MSQANDMRPGARRVGALSALTVVSIMTALVSGTASATAVAAPSSSVAQAKKSHSPAQTRAQQTGPDLQVVKTGTTAVQPNGSVSYTITVKNNGPGTSTGWTVTDYLPAGLLNPASSTPGCTFGAGVMTCVGGPLAAGASSTITVTGTAGPNFTHIQNIATVIGLEPDPNLSNNISSATTAISGRLADLQVAKTGPATVEQGDRVTYTITVTNNGPNTATGWAVVDRLPSGLRDARASSGCRISRGVLTCTGRPLASGASVTFTVTGTAGRVTALDNTVTVQGRELDPDHSNNTSTLHTTVTPRIRADLQLTKTGPTSAAPGATVTYTITVKNNGPDASTGWTVTDRLPARLLNPTTSTPGCAISGGVLTCTGGALASGASSTITVTGTADQRFNGVENLAVVHGSDVDPNPRNNTGSTAARHLRITESVKAPRVIRRGDTVRYTIRVRNTGKVAYTSTRPASFTDNLSGVLDDARFNDDADATTGTVSYAEPRLHWVGTLRPGETATITFSVTVQRRSSGDRRLVNRVVSGAQGSNCAAGSRSRDCSTLNRVDARDQGRRRDLMASDGPRLTKRS
ncbi:DUF11 domain-containing protein [Streptomyces nodosus]|uniref:DUF11 domain-containing protein n=1 Tax=Streptomyces nodosus TaxID=40318 RepID=UPI00345279CB